MGDVHAPVTSAEFPGSSNSTVMGETGGFPMSIIVTGFFVTSLAYLVCFCCCVIQFFLRRRNNAARHPGRTGGSAEAAIARSDEQKNDTLKKRFLHQFRNSLRKLKKSRSPLPTTTGSSPSDPCAICLLEYTGSSQEIMIGYIAGCEHFFHFDCIWTWLEAKGNCPLCRQKVILKEEDIKGMSLKRVLQVLNEGQAARAQDKNSPPELQGVSVVSDQYSRQVNGLVISRDTNSVEGGNCTLQGGGSHVWVSNPHPSDPASPGTSYVPEIVCQNDSSSDAWPQGSRPIQMGGPMDNYAFDYEEQAPIPCDVRSDTITVPDTSLHTHTDSSVEHAGDQGRNIGDDPIV